MIQSKRNYWREYVAYPILFIVFSFLAFAIFVNEPSSKYLNLQLMLPDVFFIAISAIGFVFMMNFDGITIVDKTLIVYSIFGTKRIELELSDITSWTEIERKGKGGGITKYFTIYFNDHKYRFKSSYYKNYDEIAASIMPYGIRDINLENVKKNEYTGKGGPILISLGIITLVISICLYFSITKIISPIQVATIAGVVGNKPEIEVSSKGAKSMVILLQNYPDFAFRISGSTYKAMHANKYVYEVQYGDSIFINVDKGVYERKIIRKESMTFLDKYWDYRHLKPLEIYTRYTSYLSLNDYNKENNNDVVGFVVCGVMGLFWILIGVVILRRKDKHKVAEY